MFDVVGTTLSAAMSSNAVSAWKAGLAVYETRRVVAVPTACGLMWVDKLEMWIEVKD